jgi:hypothetical protein
MGPPEYSKIKYDEAAAFIILNLILAPDLA